MKILFIVPTSLNPKQMYLEYPMGVGYICTYLRKIGFETKIVDQHAEHASDEDIVKFVEDFSPDIIAFSVMTPCYPRALIQLKMLKYCFPQIPVIAGGIHVSIFKDSLFCDGFDVLCIGEGEVELQKFCLVYLIYNKLLKNDSLRINPETKFNILDGFPLELEKYLYTEELLLDRDVYNLKLYTHHSVLAARGCPFRCKFCCNYSKIFGVKYGRTVLSVIKEIEILEKKYKAKQVFFADDIFFQTKKKIIDFCEAYIKAGLTVSWIAQLRVNTIDSETALLMKKCGCVKICYGIESGSQDILNKANKCITLTQIKNGIKFAKDAGIRVKTFWILGLPGSYEQQLKSLDLMIEIKPNDISIHKLIPFPGTDYYNNPDKYGIKINNKHDLRSYCYGGIDDNFEFTYLSNDQILKLLSIFSIELEKVGYISSDNAKPDSEYVYSLPISKKSLKVFNK